MHGGGTLVGGKGEEGGFAEGAGGFVIFDGRWGVEFAIDDLNGLLVSRIWVRDAYNI